MQPSSFSSHLSNGSPPSFCWEQWAQMGVLADPIATSDWATDPEALIVLTLEVARAEPRLFDELLDWMLRNESLLSVRRLRSMCTSPTDEKLVDAAIRWLAWERPSARLKTPPATTVDQDTLEALFHGGGPVRERDESFAAAGFLRPVLHPSGKSRAPDLLAPINLGLRLRAILGVGIRAEVIRVMLGTRAPWMSAQALAQSAGYSKRNVHDALAGLAAAATLTDVHSRRRTALRDRQGNLGAAAEPLARGSPLPP